jgi:CheY-like chemotaxis protein
VRSDGIVWAARTAGSSELPEAKLLISVVEDDRFFRESMGRLMRSLGYSAEAFASAADFLGSPRITETACLIADVNMPAMTGVALYRHLVEAGPPRPLEDGGCLCVAYPVDSGWSTYSIGAWGAHAH